MALFGLNDVRERANVPEVGENLSLGGARLVFVVQRRQEVLDLPVGQCAWRFMFIHVGHGPSLRSTCPFQAPVISPRPSKPTILVSWTERRASLLESTTPRNRSTLLSLLSRKPHCGGSSLRSSGLGATTRLDRMRSEGLVMVSTFS